jgi:hypothetical protein
VGASLVTPEQDGRVDERDRGEPAEVAVEVLSHAREVERRHVIVSKLTISRPDLQRARARPLLASRVDGRRSSPREQHQRHRL